MTHFCSQFSSFPVFATGKLEVRERFGATVFPNPTSPPAFQALNGLVRLVHCEMSGRAQTHELRRGLVEKLDTYLTIKEAAEFLGVSLNTLRNWGRDGKVPMHRNPVNGYRLFKKSDLEQLLRETQQSRSKPSKTK